MNDETVIVKKKQVRLKFEPSESLRVYVQTFDSESLKTKRSSIKFLQAILKKQIVEAERVKFKERMKNI